jgi:hypothetical protein
MSKPGPKSQVIAAPATIGAAVDALHKLRTERKKLEASAKALKERETALETDIFAKFKKSDLDGARGKLAQASIQRADHPTFEDWDAFAKHLKKNPDDLDLLQRRLSAEACRERWAEKLAIPGVGVFTSIKLSLTKVKGR